MNVLTSTLILLLNVLSYFPIEEALALSINHSSHNNNNDNNNMTTKNAAQKAIKEICRKPRSHWVGDGFHVFPVFANKAFTNEMSPFLMFDYAAPKEFLPSVTRANNNKRRGVGQHPHRGFETVTISFQGEVEHADSKGNKGVIGPGDVQWMTAAKGIIHEEYHSTQFTEKGGIFEMCQLWVNLPKKSKMVEPRYQSILDSDIPKVPLRGSTSAGNDGDKVCNVDESLKEGYARIIAGEFKGVKGPAMTYSPVNLWDVGLLKQEKEFELEFAEGHTTLVFVRKGSVEVQGKKLSLADVAIMENAGTKISIKATQDDTSILIMSGEPLNEPIAARGPFVMNTQQELQEAMHDYQFGMNGFHHY